MVNATWFDGRSSTRHAVQWRLDGATLEVQHGGLCMRHPADALQLPEPAPGADRPVGLPDGSVLWLEAASAVQGLPALRQAAGRRLGVAPWLMGRWPAVAACLLLLVAGFAWFNHQGAGLLARAALPLVPRTVDQQIGELAWPKIEQRWLAPTRNFERCLRLRDRFMAVAEKLHTGTVVLTCARAQTGSSFNALVLPDGHIVLLDGLLNALDDDEAMAVLGHELGHVVHRHSMQALMRSAGLAAVAGVVLGDFSSVAVGATVSLQGLAYSRDAEREADRFALEFLDAAGIDHAVMKRVWAKFIAMQERVGASGIPAWISSHPPTQERLRAVEVAR